MIGASGSGSRFHVLIKSKAVRDSLIVISGNLFNALLGLLAVMVISRHLGPTGFGVFAVFTSIVLTVTNLTDLGLATAAIKLISSYRATDSRKADVVMKVIFKLELLTGLVVGALGLVFSGQIASLLGGSHLLTAVRLAFIGSIFSSAGAFVVPFFSSHRLFARNALINASVAIFKTGGVLLLSALAILHLESIFWLYIAATVLIFLLGTLFAPKGYLVKAGQTEQKQALGEIFHFSKWIFLSFIATSLMMRLDLFLISRFKGSAEVGIYAAAQQLVFFAPLMIGAVVNVLLPRVSAMKEKGQFKSYIKHVVLGAAVVSAAILPLFILAEPLVKLVFGSSYLPAIKPFKPLLLAYVFSLFANPISLIIYALNRPKVLTVFNFIQLAFSVGLNLYLIPLLGAYGGGLAFLAVTLLGGSLVIAYSFKLISNYQRPVKANG